MVAVDRVEKYLKSLIPSYVEKMEIISPSENFVTPFYEGYKSLCSWPKSFQVNRLLHCMDDYYVFRVWDSEEQKRNTYYMKGWILCEAIGLRHITYLWAYHDYALASLLCGATKKTKQQWKILSIIYNGKDVTKDLKHILPSIAIPNNVTAKALVMYYETCVLKKEFDPKKDDDYTLTIVDCDLDEKVVKNDEYVI